MPGTSPAVSIGPLLWRLLRGSVCSKGGLLSTCNIARGLRWEVLAGGLLHFSIYLVAFWERLLL